LVIVLSSILFCLSEAKLTKECLVDYLKFRNVNDEAFDSIDAYTGDPGTCTDEIKTKVGEIYSLARSKMEANFKQKPYADCAMKDVESEEYQNILLKAEAIELKGVGIKFWKLGSKKSKVEELQKNAQEIVDTALINCKGQTDYGAFFDTFYEQKKNEPMADDFSYCMRKYLVDRSVVSRVHYNININPKNIRINNINCDEIMRVAIEELRASVSAAGSECVIKKFVDSGYFDLILKIQLLTKLNLSSTEKENEKELFINSMIQMTHQIKTCPM
jgi:hypothetical protein